MTTPNLNVDNYTISELLGIIELDDPTTNDIIYKTNYYIKDFSKKQKPELVSFFQSIQTKLLQYMNQLETSGTLNIIQIINKRKNGLNMKHFHKIILFKRIK